MNVDLEILCVGNELLIGKILNTNAQWLGKQATALAANVKRITIIQDYLPEIVAALQEALARKPQFIITTGGLGPTFDDKTLEGVAKGLNRKLELNPEALAVVKQRIDLYAKKRGIPTPVELTKHQLKMAMLPENSKPVRNPVGTAPPVQIDLPSTTIFVLPGVPSEMEAIFNETIAPKLKQATGGLVFYERSLILERIWESVLAPLIDKVMAQYLGVYVKSHPFGTNGQPNLELHLTITANEAEDPQSKLDGAVEMLKQLVVGSSGVVIRVD